MHPDLRLIIMPDLGSFRLLGVAASSSACMSDDPRLWLPQLSDSLQNIVIVMPGN